MAGCIRKSFNDHVSVRKRAPKVRMKIRTIISFFWIALVCIGCNNVATTPDSQPADIVLTNGAVKTPGGWAEALAISGDKIIAVGDVQTVSQLVGESTTVVELGGSTVLPGFHDSHVHPLYGGMMYSGADHTNCKIAQGLSAEQVKNTLSKCVLRVTKSEWVTGGQWDASALGGVPDRFMIDGVAPDTPVLINDTSGTVITKAKFAL